MPKPLDNALSTDSKKPFHHIRLPKYVKPTNYDVFLDVNMTSKHVNGNVSIKVKIVQPTMYVLIHAFGFQTLNGVLLDEENKVIPTLRQFSYTENQYFVMELKEELAAGSYVLQYKYSYQLKTSLAGFYQASYRMKSGKVS